MRHAAKQLAAENAAQASALSKTTPNTVIEDPSNAKKTTHLSASNEVEEVNKAAPTT